MESDSESLTFTSNTIANQKKSLHDHDHVFPNQINTNVQNSTSLPNKYFQRRRYTNMHYI